MSAPRSESKVVPETWKPRIGCKSLHGLHLEDNAIRVAVGLRLGCTICEAHPCPCGAAVDSLGQHALSFKKNAGRVQRHAWLNDLIHRALIRAEFQQSKSHRVSVETMGKGLMV